MTINWGPRSRSRATSVSIAMAVVSLVHRSPEGCTAITNSALLTSMPITVWSMLSLLSTTAPGLM